MEIILVLVALMFIYLISKSFMSYETKHENKNNQTNNKHESRNNRAKDWSKKDVPKEEEGPSSLEKEAGLIVALMSKVASADGKVCDIEKELIYNMLYDFSTNFMDQIAMQEILKNIFETEKNNVSNVSDIASQVFDITKYEYNKRVKILEYLFNLAFIDKNFSSKEESIIELIAESIKIKSKDYEKIFESFKNIYSNEIATMNINKTHAYEQLDLTPNATVSEIKKRYKTLIKRHHPDLVTGKGLGEEDVKKATIKLQEINEAYEIVKKDKGI
jgi:DnaJ like chaperone protein